MANGTVKWFNTNKKYGFIVPAEGGKDIFVHIKALQKSGMQTLNDGQQVSYDVENRNGKTSAINIVLVD